MTTAHLLTFHADAFAAMAICLSTAFALGLVIGLERQIRQRSAGLRTMVLVAVGAAAFTLLGGRLLGGEGQKSAMRRQQMRRGKRTSRRALPALHRRNRRLKLRPAERQQADAERHATGRRGLGDRDA